LDPLHCSGWAACVLLVVRNVYVVCSCSRVCACDAREFTLCAKLTRPCDCCAAYASSHHDSALADALAVHGEDAFYVRICVCVRICVRV